jgi:hypothetical protein
LLNTTFSFLPDSVQGISEVIMSEARPNIVLIVGEDVGRHLGCYGDDYAITPNLDRLAADGTLYTNGFTHAPVCAPSRSGPGHRAIPVHDRVASHAVDAGEPAAHVHP